MNNREKLIMKYGIQETKKSIEIHGFVVVVNDPFLASEIADAFETSKGKKYSIYHITIPKTSISEIKNKTFQSIGPYGNGPETMVKSFTPTTRGDMSTETEKE
jgi:hypothetical protein